MKKISIFIIFSIATLCFLFLLFCIIGHKLVKEEYVRIDKELKQVLLDNQLSFLDELANLLSVKDQQSLRKLSSLLQARIKNIDEANGTTEGEFDNFDLEAGIYYDELCFLNAILSEMQELKENDIYEMINDRFVSIRIRLLMSMPLSQYGIEHEETKLPEYLFYFRETTKGGIGNDDRTDNQLKAIENEMKSLSEEIPLLIISWKNGKAALYSISERLDSSIFIEEVENFYNRNDWEPINYDICFPMSSRLREDGWFRVDGEKELWTSFWFKESLGIVSVNLYYVGENINSVVIINSQKPELSKNVKENLDSNSQLSLEQMQCFYLY